MWTECSRSGFVKVKTFSNEPLQVRYLVKQATEKRILGAFEYKELSKNEYLNKT